MHLGVKITGNNGLKLENKKMKIIYYLFQIKIDQISITFQVFN